MISDLYKSFETSVLSPHIPFTQRPQMLISYQIHLVYTNISEQAVISSVGCGLWVLIPPQIRHQPGLEWSQADLLLFRTHL